MQAQTLIDKIVKGSRNVNRIHNINVKLDIIIMF